MAPQTSTPPALSATPVRSIFRRNTALPAASALRYRRAAVTPAMRSSSLPPPIASSISGAAARGGVARKALRGAAVVAAARSPRGRAARSMLWRVRESRGRGQS